MLMYQLPVESAHGPGLVSDATVVLYLGLNAHRLDHLSEVHKVLKLPSCI